MSRLDLHEQRLLTPKLTHNAWEPQLQAASKPKIPKTRVCGLGFRVQESQPQSADPPSMLTRPPNPEGTYLLYGIHDTVYIVLVFTTMLYTFTAYYYGMNYFNIQTSRIYHFAYLLPWNPSLPNASSAFSAEASPARQASGSALLGGFRFTGSLKRVI